MTTQRKRTGASMDAALDDSAKKRRKPARLPGPSKASISLLRKLDEGKILSARRTFPREWHYMLEGAEVDAGRVTPLIRDGMLSAGATKSTDDTLVYRITPLGRERLQSEPQSDIPNQLDWVGDE